MTVIELSCLRKRLGYRIETLSVRVKCERMRHIYNEIKLNEYVTYSSGNIA